MKKGFCLIFSIFCYTQVFCQTPNQTFPYDFYSNQKLDHKIYGIENKFHSSIKPYLADDYALALSIDSMRNIGLDTGKRSLLKRKLFEEHLIEINKKDYQLYIDFLPDFQTGKELQESKNTWLNTRGFQIGGNIGTKFSFYTSGYESQALFPTYIQKFINTNGIIPSQTNDNFGPEKTIKDYSFSTTTLSYTPIKYLNITLGQDKNFIGDGYRSMLLSDVATNYPFLKITGNLGDVKYMSMWAQFQDLTAPQFSYENGYRKKWGVFHYLDWNINKRLSLGFFDSVIWNDADSTGKRGFDFSYINPLSFLRPVERQNGSPDNAVIGFNGNYKLNGVTIYGQFLLDEFDVKHVFSGDGYWANKSGLQLGLRGYDLLGLKGFRYLTEFNTARPYTYSGRTSLTNYGHYNQALAHPFGANFKEWVTMLGYVVGRFNFSSEIDLAKYGLDGIGKNFGKDIFKPYKTRQQELNNKVAQGLVTDFTYLNFKTAYLLNSKYNLRIELEATHRNEKNLTFNNTTNWITIGLRSSFRNIYYDF
nr:gliding motility protein RemB [Pseudopedobacter sp.]